MQWANIHPLSYLAILAALHQSTCEIGVSAQLVELRKTGMSVSDDHRMRRTMMMRPIPLPLAGRNMGRGMEISCYNQFGRMRGRTQGMSRAEEVKHSGLHVFSMNGMSSSYYPERTVSILIVSSCLGTRGESPSVITYLFSARRPAVLTVYVGRS